jgi:hypothetical protein
LANLRLLGPLLGMYCVAPGKPGYGASEDKRASAEMSSTSLGLMSSDPSLQDGVLRESSRGSSRDAARDTTVSEVTAADRHGTQDRLAELHDKLEVSYQWAYDLETDLEDSRAQVSETEDRCSMLQGLLCERDDQLQSAVCALDMSFWLVRDTVRGRAFEGSRSPVQFDM